MAKENPFDYSQGIGIYIDIEPTEKRDKSNHRLYKARCKVCGRIVYRVKYDLLHYHDICFHSREDSKYIESSEIDTEWAKLGYTFQVFGVYCKNSKKYLRSGKIYDLWRHMIYRTTPEFWKQFPTYEGTTVCEEWRDYSTFCDDIKDLDGYDLFINNTKPNNVMIDKDTKVPGNKHYSKETCCFITHADSNRDVAKRHPDKILHENMIQLRKYNKHSKGKKVKATNIKTQQTYYFYSIKDCGKFLQCNPANIQMCLSDLPQYAGHYTCKGHTLEEVTEEELNNNLDKVIIYEVKEKT